MLNEVIEGNCVEKLKDLPDNSVDLVITSPPYDNIEGSGYSKGKKDLFYPSRTHQNVPGLVMRSSA